MYSENSKSASMQRANNEFLRRMLGGELSVGSLPVFNNENPALPEYPVRPPCNDGENVENGSIGEMEEHCGGCANMPSLAMVSVRSSYVRVSSNHSFGLSRHDAVLILPSVAKVSL